MENLELKHLAPYLPYELPIEPIYKSTFMGGYNQRILDTSILDNYGLEEIKPILRPLSDLFNGNYKDILDEFSPISLENFKIAFLSELKPLNAFDKINYTIAVKLFENHFDLFGLIEKGLAIDINQLK